MVTVTDRERNLQPPLFTTNPDDFTAVDGLEVVAVAAPHG